MLYFSANPNGEAEVVSVILKTHQRLKKLKFDIDFADLIVKGRASKGNLVTKYPIKKVELKQEGVSTLAPRKIWFDDAVKRLNADERGRFLGDFKGEDRILTLNPKQGEARLMTFDLGNHFDDTFEVIEKWQPNKPLTCVYFDADKNRYFVKRFLVEDTLNVQNFFPSENEKSYVELVSTDYRPVIEVVFSKEKGHEREAETIELESFIAVKGIKAQGNQLTVHKVKQIKTLDPLPYEVVEEEEEKEEGTQDTQQSLFEE